MASLVGTHGWAQAPVDTAHGKTVTAEAVVITGTLRERSRLDSPVPTEVYAPALFRRFAARDVLDGVTQITGVQSNLACGVCYTGGIQINGLEGPYTLVLIDGLPIISGLATVYGLSGIPNSLIQQIELVRGPGSALYGSEALAGTLNIRTLQPWRLPRWTVDVQASSHAEANLDITRAFARSKHLTGVLSYSGYQHHSRWDRNADGFTDLPLIGRHSLFTKWNLHGRTPAAQPVFTTALRYYYEDRFGGQLAWRPEHRGGDVIYGESIFTHRVEWMGSLRLSPALQLSYSFAWHDQYSVYGTMTYLGQQAVGFAQLLYSRQLAERHQLLTGATFRYTHYDDNTPATAADALTSRPDRVALPGAFAQHEWTLAERHSLLSAVRMDHSSVHGAILSGRIAYKWAVGPLTTLRASAGNGFRVVNLFTEDHAALSGARQVVIVGDLAPERSTNLTLNLLSYLPIGGARSMLTLDAALFYTHFSNQILPDYDTDPQQIRYSNLEGFGVSRGASLQATWREAAPGGERWTASLGLTALDVARYSAGGRSTQPLVSPLQGTYQLSRRFARLGLTLDVTGQFYAPMRLPTVPNDFRPERSPWFTLLNVQLTQQLGPHVQLYTTIRNALDLVPRDPLLRPFDPFDRSADDPVANPNGYRFDTAYGFASMQGRRVVLGLRWMLD